MNSLQDYEMLLRSMSQQMSLAHRAAPRHSSNTPVKDRNTNHNSRVGKPLSNRPSPQGFNHNRSTPTLRKTASFQFGEAHPTSRTSSLQHFPVSNHRPAYSQGVIQPNGWQFSVPHMSQFQATGPAMSSPHPSSGYAEDPYGNAPSSIPQNQYSRHFWNPNSHLSTNKQQVSAIYNSGPSFQAGGFHNNAPHHFSHSMHALPYQNPYAIRGSNGTIYPASQGLFGGNNCPSYNTSKASRNKPKGMKPQPDGGQELIGMGLYDDKAAPASSSNSLLLSSPADSSSAPSLILSTSSADPRPPQTDGQGLNLKLEESWKPPSSSPPTSPAECNVPEAEDDIHGIDTPLLSLADLDDFGAGFGDQDFGHNVWNTAATATINNIDVKSIGWTRNDTAQLPQAPPGFSMPSHHHPYNPAAGGGQRYPNYAGDHGLWPPPPPPPPPPQHKMEHHAPTLVRDANGHLTTITDGRRGCFAPGPDQDDAASSAFDWHNGHGGYGDRSGFASWA